MDRVTDQANFEPRTDLKGSRRAASPRSWSWSRRWRRKREEKEVEEEKGVEEEERSIKEEFLAQKTFRWPRTERPAKLAGENRAKRKSGRNQSRKMEVIASLFEP